jgi:hypothetical protein
MDMTEGWNVDDVDIPDHSQLVDLMVTQRETEANLVRSILEDAGIHCILLCHVPPNVYPFTVDGLATIRVQVLDTQLDDARAVLKEHEEIPEASPDEDPEGINGE